MASTPEHTYNTLKYHLQHLNNKESDIYLIEFQKNPENIHPVLTLLQLQTDIDQFLLQALGNLQKIATVDPDIVFKILIASNPTFHVLKCWYQFFVCNNYHRIDELLTALDDKSKISLLTIFLESENTRYHELATEMVGKFIGIYYRESLELLHQLLLRNIVKFEKRKILLELVLQVADMDEIEVVSDVIVEFMNDHLHFELVYHWILAPKLLFNLSDSLNNHDDNFLTAYTAMLAKFGDQFMIDLLKRLPETSQFFETLMIITAYSVNLEIPQMTFYLWFELEDNMDCKNELNSNEISPEVMEYGHGLFTRLLQIIMNHVKFPLDSVLRIWGSDQHEAFRNHRVECADTALYCYYNLQERALETVITLLNVEIANQQQQNSTQNVEACLYLLKAFSETIPYDESKYLKLLFSQNTVDYLRNAVDKQFDGYFQLRNTVCRLFGSYGDWFANNGGFLSPAITFLIGELEHSSSPISAATALTDLTSVCQKELSKHCDHVLTLYFDVINKCPMEVQGKIIQSMISVVQPLKGDIATERTLFILNSIVDNIRNDLSAFSGDLSCLIHHIGFLTYFAKGSRNTVIDIEDSVISEAERKASQQLVEIFIAFSRFIFEKDFTAAAIESIQDIGKSYVKALQFTFPNLIKLVVHWFTSTGNVELVPCCSVLLKNCPKHLVQSNSETIDVACKELSDAVCKCYIVDPDIPAEYFDFLTIVYFINKYFRMLPEHASVIFPPPYNTGIFGVVLLSTLDMQESAAIQSALRFIRDFVFNASDGAGKLVPFAQRVLADLAPPILEKLIQVSLINQELGRKTCS